MNAATKIASPPIEPIALVQAWDALRLAGFILVLDDQRLLVTPADRLTSQQDAFIRAHKAPLVALLTDRQILAAALDKAGSAGLGWREGTPPDWSDKHLLTVGELLYREGRMVSRLERRYGTSPEMTHKVAPDPSEQIALEQWLSQSQASGSPQLDQDLARAFTVLVELYRQHVARLVEGGHDGKGALVCRNDYWKALRRARLAPEIAFDLLDAGRVRVQADGLYWVPLEEIAP